MATTTSHSRSMSKTVLKALGLGYVPELVQDTTGKSVVSLPGRSFTPIVSEKNPIVTVVPAVDKIDKLEDDVAQLGIRERSTPPPRLASENTLTDGNTLETDVATLRVQSRAIPPSPATLEATLTERGTRSLSSDSGSTLTETTNVPLVQYINSNCPHIAKPFYVPPLLLPTWSLQEFAGFSGWFTKKIKTDLKWER